MTPHERLNRVATLIYGGQWVAALARDLGVAERSAQRWRSGRDPIAPGVFADLARIAAALAGAVPGDARRKQLLDAAALAA